ncbi:hypothetical protein [Bradyrhizobium elkanii]|uniref:hypothetical protein n=1 Tax=Bradyrhizobium elkanii TaxID=29448 RepID=UPI000571914C|nr:hypothetical protein [Bradyrhizobium elkanii]WLA78817.1 hypothetical protein QNJ99_25680 [Bradyrhizobium elkanii]
MAQTLTFAADVDAWVKQTKQRMLAVFRESSQRVASIANNGVPVDTGFARSSIRASTESMPKIDPSAKGREGATYPDGLSEIALVIGQAQLGTQLFIGWTCSYIIPLEFGHSSQAPQGFARLAAAQWQSIVSQVAAEARSRAGD